MVIVAFAFCASFAAAASPPPPDLADLSLEQLAQVIVTSVSGHEEPVSAAAASIYVITNDEIRRSGVTTLPEALRLAPNLQVARVNAAQYAITARGSNNAIGNKLLVLVDGRSIYAPFFSGVLWDMQDVMLQDVDRIEVISGPGGTLWGTNAVNGVINIVTKPSALTQGALAVAAAGDQESQAAVRYGGPLGNAGHFRAFVKASRLQNTETASGKAVPDRWDRLLGGFRTDWSSSSDALMLEGNASHGSSQFRGFAGSVPLDPIEFSDANLVGRWTRQLQGGSEVRVQGYLDHSTRDDALLWRPHEDVADIQAQHTVPLGRHRLLWGGEYRRAREDLEPGVSFGFVPTKSTLTWTSLFGQGEVNIAPGLDATAGLRLEHNVYTGTEALPNARIAWHLGDRQLLWSAASRAVRAPAPLDKTIRFPPNPPFLIAGGPDFHSEVANVYEVGYRGQPARTITVSVTGHYEIWHGLRSGQAPPNAMVQNQINGHESGVEMWGAWQVTPAWRLSGGLTTLQKDLRLDPSSTDPVGPSNMGNDPHHQWTMRSSFSLASRQEVDIAVRHVASLPVPPVPAYTAVDLRYAWRVRPNVELSFVLRNAFDPSHPEFEAAPGRSEIPRSALLQVTWAPSSSRAAARE